jgi:rhodanese-related sulfurtransferase
MVLTVIAIAILGLGVAGYTWWRKRERDQILLKAHSIDVDELHSILFADGSQKRTRVLDVRQPLDLLAYSQIIPGAERFAPKDILANPQLIIEEGETVVYCTCPTDKTAHTIINKTLSLGYKNVRLLKGGLDAWKEKGYPVEAYETAFRLDTPA